MVVIFPLDYAQAGTIIDDVRFLRSRFLDKNADLPKKRNFMIIWYLQFPLSSVQLPNGTVM